VSDGLYIRECTEEKYGSKGELQECYLGRSCSHRGWYEQNSYKKWYIHCVPKKVTPKFKSL